MTNSPVEFSVIVTCYFEEKSIDEFYQRLSGALRASGRSYEIVFVNDGSTDRTFERLTGLFDKNADVYSVIDLYRNVGQAAAITAGLQEARGKSIVLIDSDLQIQPEDWPLLLAKHDEGFDIVQGYRIGRKDSLFRRIPSYFANVVMRKAAGHQLSDFGCTFKIYPAALIKGFQFDQYRMLDQMPLIRSAGRVTEVGIRHFPRKYGRSGWRLNKLFAYNLDNFLNLVSVTFHRVIYLNVILAVLIILRIGLEFILPFSVLPTVTNGLLLNISLFSLVLSVSMITLNTELTRRTLSLAKRIPIYVVKTRLKKSA